ncbi:DUF4126 domain-containing protein [Aquabacterium sp. OR-4]|uniref:DUF4126 domain-containing protein n=1 Tax=Aquabacterium sp. OR-4 TaxID=2978127 RepID=UPI0021B4AAC0|nr:DUF4126 domain-containing protein [Aquabacterium sp. OR-4]MDT7837397.1 DUF4126 domain-containing protein [Aquabacterium sp. OR-4]
MNLLPATLDTSHLLALAAALGWASGLRLYGVLFATGMAGWLGAVALPPGLQVLQHPLALCAAGVMLLTEFVADKIPWIDSLWDALHALLRVPAGAALAAAVFGGEHQAWAWAAAVLGGSLAATAQLAKSATRAAVNTSPEPFSNIALSLAGDAAVPAMLWLAWAHPAWFAVALVLVVAVMLVLIVLLLKFVRTLGRTLRQRFGGGAARAGLT